MHTLLLAAALAVGSGDGRDGAMDARTVEQVPPYALPRIAMDIGEVTNLFGLPESIVVDPLPTGFQLVYLLKPDWFGRRYEVHVDLNGWATGMVTGVRLRLLD